MFSNIPRNLQFSLLNFRSTVCENPFYYFFFFTDVHCRTNFWFLEFGYLCTIHARFLLLILHPSRIYFTYHFQKNQTHVVKNFAYLVPCTSSLPILSRAIWWSHRSKFGIFYDTEAGETITFCWKFMIPSSVLRVYVRATCRLHSAQFYWLGTVHMIRQGFSPIWIFCSQSRETIKLWYRRLKPVPKTDLAFHLCLKSRNFLKCGVDDQHWFDPNPIFNRTRSL